jgi:Fe-S cluster assembly iron-binding protein IscA
MEIIITRPAKDNIREVAMKNNILPQVRVYAQQATCCSAKFAIAFDKPTINDEVTYSDEIALITDKEYMPRYARVLLIDYCKDGFLIEAYVKPEKNCAKSTDGGCGSCHGCSSCSHK